MAGRRTGLPPLLGWKWEVVNPFCHPGSLLPLGLAIEFTQRKSADATPIASQKARLILALRRQRPFCLEEGSVSHHAHAWSISILPVGSIESSSLLKPFLRRDRRAKLDSKCFREAAATGINGLALKANLFFSCLYEAAVRGGRGWRYLAKKKEHTNWNWK